MNNKIIILILCIVLTTPLFCVNFVSAGDWFSFDNYKSFDEGVGDYGKVTILDRNLFTEDVKLQEIELKKNTKICDGVKCNATLEIIMHEPGVLISDKRFLDLKDESLCSIKNLSFYIINGKERIVYKPGAEVGVGIFNFYFEGQVEPFKKCDWQIEVGNNFWINEWAIWESSFNDKLVAYYPFDENSGVVLEDVFSSNFNGTLRNISNANWVPGKINNALLFNGSTSEQHINDFGRIEPLENANWTISFWMNPITPLGTNIVFGYDDDETLDAKLYFWRRADGRHDLHSGAGETTTTNYSSWGINQAGWKLITIRQNDTDIRLYINETLASVTASTGNVVCASCKFKIGGGFDALHYFEGYFDEWLISNRSWSADEVSNLYNDGFGLSYNALGVLLKFPLNNSFSIDFPMNFSVNITPEITGELSNATLFVWDIDGIILGQSTNIITGAIENTTNFSISNLPVGASTWNVFGCSNDSSFTTCSFAPINFSLNYGIQINSQTFNNLTTEGATETFSINFTKLSSTQLSTVNLIYNGTVNSIASLVDGDNVISSGSIIIPQKTVDSNVSFYWNIKFGDGEEINTTSNNQGILILDVDDCGVFTNLIYNFTQFDEQEKTVLRTNNTMELQFNLYDTSKSVNLVNFSQTFFGENPAQVCLEDEILTTVNYSSYVVVKYFANSTTVSTSTPTYSTEYYNILNETIGNTTVPKNIALYDLKEDDTTSFRLTFRDDVYSLAPNILVQIHRQYVEDNDFKIVEIPLTDSNGQTILNLVRNSIIYNFIMVNEAGEVIATFNQVTAFCQDFTIGECTIILAAESIGEDVYDYNEEFRISITAPTYDNSTELISIDFITDDLQPKNLRMDVFRNNDFGNRSVCSDSLTAASGTLSCGGSSITDSDQFLFIQTSVDESLAKQDTINLNEENLSFGIINGSFYAFLIILFLICLFMDDKKILVISLGIGWVIIISLGLISGRLIGVLSAGIWILTTIIIYLWKLNKDGGI